MEMSKAEYHVDKWPDNHKIGILLICVEHLLNDKLAEESWDNPYSKDEAIQILRDIYLNEGYNMDYVKKIFKVN